MQPRQRAFIDLGAGLLPALRKRGVDENLQLGGVRSRELPPPQLETA
jgi:hypothetical protein